MSPTAALLLTTLLLAATDAGELARARRLVDELAYAEAIPILEHARREAAGDSGSLTEVLDLLARCQVAEGRRAEAEASFRELLLIAPAHDLGSSTSPKIREAFLAAKAKMYPKDHLALRTEPSPPGSAAGVLVDPWGRAAGVYVVVEPSAGVAGAEARVEVVGGRFQHDLGGRVAAWRVEARSVEGRVLATARPAPGALPSAAASPGPDADAMRAPGADGRGAGDLASPKRSRGWALGTSIAAGAVLSAAAWLQWRSIDNDRASRSARWVDEGRELSQLARRDAGWAAGLYIGAGVLGAGATALWVFE